MELSSLQTILLSLLIVLVLLLPLTLHKVEENLEIFLFACGAFAVTVSNVWSAHLVLTALEDPIKITVAVLVAGLLFRQFHTQLQKLTQYAIKKLGLRLIILPAAIFLGSILGGLIIGFVLRIPLNYAMISASGMGYYSLTGAMMTDYFGVEAGIYGFVVNVIRDVFTIILMPLLIRISKGSPIAAGAAGCMDTMLVPVTKAVGTELGIVALISGTILTFVVPVWLPISQMIFS